ncbi:MAG: N-acetyl-alpha-D-glucosaminyl L-malate synthase BshA [Candidatus Dadabacteria bacterium]|nr:MAG: N-acetyl-alpha-D-glucosaminyl L-malate synthase BshA [Candidatus Dadabacteria bacterium]
MSEQLRIGITCYPTYGGSGVIATEIGMAMARRGHKVHFICYDVPRRLDRFMENVYFHEVEVRDNPLFTYPPYSLALASKIVDVATYEELSLLHMHYAVPHATSAYLARQIMGNKAPKVITTLHGTDITLVGKDRSYLPITRFSIMQSDGVTVPSLFLKQATHDKLNVPTDCPIEVIPNFVDTSRYSPVEPQRKLELRRALGRCDQAEKLIIHVSNFRTVKRIQDVIRSFALVRKELQSHLVMVGDGPERCDAEALVRELGLEHDVCFLGKQESTVEVLQAGDLFLLPSENESFGLAALEAMSCGLPVVASRAEGIPEVVKDGETGLLADVGDIEGLAKNMISLLEDGERYKSMSEAARRLAVENYEMNAITARYEEYYRRVLRGWG